MGITSAQVTVPSAEVLGAASGRPDVFLIDLSIEDFERMHPGVRAAQKISTGKSWVGRTMRPGSVITAALALLLVMTACSVGDSSPRSTSYEATTVARQWMQAASTGLSEAAWDLMNADAREKTYASHEADFSRDIEQANWGQMLWRIEEAPLRRDYEWIVYVTVTTGRESVPAFLFDRGIAEPWEVDDQTPGFFLHLQEEPSSGKVTVWARPAVQRLGRLSDDTWRTCPREAA